MVPNIATLKVRILKTKEMACKVRGDGQVVKYFPGNSRFLITRQCNAANNLFNVKQCLHCILVWHKNPQMNNKNIPNKAQLGMQANHSMKCIHIPRTNTCTSRVTTTYSTAQQQVNKRV